MKICVFCGDRFEREDWFCSTCHASPPQHGQFFRFAPEVTASQVGFNERYFAALAQVEDRNFWFRARNELLVWALETNFPRAQNFLEVGCGTGYVLKGLRAAFPTLKLSGSEVLCEGLPFAFQRAPGATLFQMDARRIPFEGEFDVIGAFDVLEHIEEDERVLGQLNAALRPGGGIITTVPQHQWLWSEMDTVSGHRRRYTRKDLLRKVRKAGFSVVRITSFVSLLLPLMLVARFSKRTSLDDDMWEFNVGGMTNRILENVMQLERKLIRAGISFPFGGSLLLVARKN